jgi:hypothetical protein
VRFDVVKAKTAFDVAPDLRRFYQAEVLVPSPLPRHLIIIQARKDAQEEAPSVPDAATEIKSAAVEGGDLSVSEPTIAECAMVCEARRSSKSFSTSVSFSTSSASTTASNVSLAEGEAATSLTPQVMVHSALEGSETRLFAKFNVSAAVASASVIHERATAPKSSRRMREVPWTSSLLAELQHERKERLFSLVDPLHELQCVQFAYDADKDIAFMSRKPRPAERSDNKVGGCQMPLSRSTTCEDCTHTFYNCPKHMKQCNRPVWDACANPLCMRFLCWEHRVCYCDTLVADVKPVLMPPAPTPDSGFLSASESSSVATARKPMTVPAAAEDAMSIPKTVHPATEGAMLMRGDACPSAASPFLWALLGCRRLSLLLKT